MTITPEIINAVKNVVQKIYDVLPFPQKFILTFKEHTYSLANYNLHTLSRPNIVIRTYSAADAETESFGAVALLISPKDYGKPFKLEINPKNAPEGSFMFFLKDSDKENKTVYCLSVRTDTQAEENFFSKKAIYAVATINHSETGSIAFAGYLITDGQERHINLMRYPDKSVIEKNPTRGEEFAVNTARTALLRAGKNPKEFSVFLYSERSHYTDPEVLKELSGQYKTIKAQ